MRQLIILLLLAQTLQAQTKRGLIVAIGDYPDTYGWDDLNSNNDTLLIKQVLIKQGFNDIRILSDSKATKRGVIQALDSLYKVASLGDKVVVHFSSHGQQIEDLDGDEADGLDEAIVCYDSPRKFKEGYRGELHLIDDELNRWIYLIRTKLGESGDLLVLSDACHSGTLSRGGIQKIRGNQPAIFLSKGQLRNPSIPESNSFMSDVPEAEIVSSGLSPFVLFSAAKSNEVNSEYLAKDQKAYGSLSFAFAKAMEENNFQDSYRTLFARVKNQMQLMVPQQTPEAVGELDRNILGGEKVKYGAFYDMTPVDFDSVRIQINAGSLLGFYEGAEIGVYPAGITDISPNKLICNGKVTHSSLFKSDIYLDQKLPNEPVWAFATQKAFGFEKTTVGLDSTFSDFDFRKEIQDYFANDALIEISNSQQARYVVSIAPEIPKQLLVYDQYATTDKVEHVIQVTNSRSYLAKIKQYFEKKAKSAFLLDFNPTDEQLSAVMELLPTKTESLQDTVSIQQYLKNGNVRLDTSTLLFIKVINTGTRKLYYNIIDITPEDEINVVIPMPYDNGGGEYFLDPNKTAILPKLDRNNRINVLSIAPPFGKETLKLIVSDQPIDLRNLATERQASKQRNLGELNALEQVFDMAGQMGTRDVKGKSYPANAKASTFNLSFEIVPNK